MKVLYVYEHALSRDSEGNYYHPYADYFFKRYSFFGSPIYCCLFNDSNGIYIKQKNLIETPFVFSKISKINSFSSVINSVGLNKQTIEELIKKVDLVITKIPSVIGYMAIDLANKNSIPVLTEVMACAWDTMWNHSLKGKLVAPFMFMLCKHYAKKSNYLIYVTKEHLQRKYPSPGRSIHCSNVEIEDFTSGSKPINKTNRIDLSTMAAVDVRFKGQEYVIKTLQELNKESNCEYHYNIAGGGDPARLLNLAKKYDVATFVHYYGRLSRNEVLNLLDKTDIYIQPSKAEGLPRALIEAMSRGCACIGTYAGGTPELLSKDYLYHPSDIATLFRIIKSLSPKDIVIQGKKNKDFVYKYYRKDILDTRRNTFYENIKQDIMHYEL